MDLFEHRKDFKDFPARSSRYLTRPVLSVKEQVVIKQRYSRGLEEHGKMKADVFV
jgi:hypothetical protein